MPRFYFHLFNDAIVKDEEGAELPDIQSARDRAIEAARSLIGSYIIDGERVHLMHHIDVTDDNGRQVLSIPFKEVVDIVG